MRTFSMALFLNYVKKPDNSQEALSTCGWTQHNKRGVIESSTCTAVSDNSLDNG